MKTIVRIAMLALLAMGVVACGDDDSELPESVVAAAADDPRFSTLVQALADTGLDAVLLAGDEWTVFAPTNEAFEALPDDYLTNLTPVELQALLLYHVLPEEKKAAALIAGDGTETTAEGGDVVIQVDADTDTVVLDGRVQVVEANIKTKTGVIHAVDAVLINGDFEGDIVELLAASPRFSTVFGAVAGEGLAPTLGTDNMGDGFTVFAPTNAAFDRLPGMLVSDLAMAGILDDVLLYHVIGSDVDSGAAVAADGTSVPTLAPDGGGFYTVAVDLDTDGDLFLDGRTEVTFVDITTENGTIHVIDSVLVPGGGFPGSTVDALAAYPRFDSLVGAVLDEGLAGAVSGVTVFAPTNDAFASADLMGNTLASVLAYHLLGEVKGSGDLLASETTLQGSNISIDTSMGVVIDGSAEVIRADIDTADGVIHVIDAVLVPAAAP